MKSYLCHIHGKDGNPKCGECWSILFDLLEDKNAITITDFETLNYGIAKKLKFDVTGDRGKEIEK